MSAADGDLLILTKILCGLEAQSQLGTSVPKIFDAFFLSKAFTSDNAKGPFSEASEWILKMQKSRVLGGVPWKEIFSDVLHREASSANQDMMSRMFARDLLQDMEGRVSIQVAAQGLLNSAKRKAGLHRRGVSTLKQSKRAVPS